ncbi:MAG TPA: class II aldolase/adducin family protein [Alphaproteobacteria bacterium]
MSADQDARELIAKACRVVGRLNLTKGATGHISQLSADGRRIFIRGRGREEVGVRYTTAAQVMAVDLDGKQIDGAEGLAAPQEVYIHTWIYKTRPDVRSVVHIHPPTVVLFTMCKKDIEPIFGAYDPSSLDLILDGIPTYDRSVLVSDDQLGQELAEALGDKRVCLMRGHGITAVGSSVEEATMRAIQLNEAAEMNYRANLLGIPLQISEEDLRVFRGKKKQREASGLSPHLTSSWRYYVELTDA